MNKSGVFGQATPTLSSVLSEHETLNRALKAEQQLYSSLVKTVKESDRYHSTALSCSCLARLPQISFASCLEMLLNQSRMSVLSLHISKSNLHYYTAV